MTEGKCVGEPTQGVREQIRKCSQSTEGTGSRRPLPLSFLVQVPNPLAHTFLEVFLGSRNMMEAGPFSGSPSPLVVVSFMDEPGWHSLGISKKVQGDHDIFGTMKNKKNI